MQGIKLNKKFKTTARYTLSMKCLLIGNYGVGNLGDEALREYFLTRFPEVEWIVLSAHPTRSGEVPRLPFGLRSLLCTPWWRTFRALRSSDAVVFGGGSLFTDSESVMACVLWWWHGFVARLFGKPLILAFQGIGPIRTGAGELCARKTIAAAVFVSVRDEESFSRVRDRDRGRVPVLLSFDPVLSFFSEASVVHAKSDHVLAIIPRMNSGDALRSAVQDFLRQYQVASVRILSMQPDSDQEQQLCKNLRLMIGSSASVHPVRALQELTECLGRCGHVITERYHGALAAIALGLSVEIIAQKKGDKLDALRTLVGNPSALEAMRERLRTGEEELRKYLNMVK